jgi:membrane protein involved in colicin uptake
MPDADDEIEQLEGNVQAEPVPKPVEVEQPPIETPPEQPTIEQLLAKQRAELEAERATAIEAARKEAGEQALADERKRLAEEARLAAMSESERLTAERNAADERAKTADAARAKAEQDVALERQRAEFARALADSELRLVRGKDKDGRDLTDPDAERIAFEATQQLVATGLELPKALAEVQATKRWMFENRAAPVDTSNTNTGSAPAGGKRQPPKTAPEKTPIAMTESEWAHAKRKLGMVK